MDAIVLARAKHDHAQAQKEVAKADRPAFDASKVVLEKAAPGALYYGGFGVIFPTALKMLSADKLLQLFSGDIAGYKGKAKGVIGLLAAVNANANVVFVGATHSVTMESEKVWDVMVNAAARFLGPYFNNPRCSLCADADKGGAASLAKNCPLSAKIVCSFHRGETIVKTCGIHVDDGGRGAKEHYRDVVLATTQNAQLRALGKLSVKERAFVDKMPLKNQCIRAPPRPVAVFPRLDGDRPPRATAFVLPSRRRKAFHKRAHHKNNLKGKRVSIAPLRAISAMDRHGLPPLGEVAPASCSPSRAPPITYYPV
jgi:hypothetical protein